MKIEYRLGINLLATDLLPEHLSVSSSVVRELLRFGKGAGEFCYITYL